MYKPELKLEAIAQELEELRIKDFVPEITKDEETGEILSSADEFENQYTDPLKAIRLIIEHYQLSGKSRIPIISEAKAYEIRKRLLTPTPTRAAQIEVPIIMVQEVRLVQVQV